MEHTHFTLANNRCVTWHNNEVVGHEDRYDLVDVVFAKRWSGIQKLSCNKVKYTLQPSLEPNYYVVFA